MGFESATPSTYVWVSTSGDDATADGSVDHPYGTIQAAVNVATAGTAVMVEAGVYTENVLLPDTAGTADAPIWLMSADGAGAATIIAATNTDSTIKGHASQYVVVDGFNVQGGLNGIAFFQDGLDFSKLVNHVVISDNTISGSVQDAIKIAQADDVTVVRNTVLNTGAGGQGVDFVAVDNSVIAYNDIAHTGAPAALFVKGGSENILIQGNYVHDVPSDGIDVGGYTLPQYIWPGKVTEAINVVVTGNRVENAGARALGIVGGQHVLATDNYLASKGTAVSVTFADPGSELYGVPKNIEVADNTFAKPYNTYANGFPSSGNFHDNTTDGVWSGAAGPAAGAGAEDLAPPDPLPVAPPPDYSAVSRTPIEGTSFADTLTAGDGPSQLDGSYGSDLLIGGLGPDALNGGVGNDTLVAGVGAAAIDGDNGYDLAVIDRSDSSQSYTVDIRTPSVLETLADGSTLLNIEQLAFYGGSGDDAVYGSTLNDTLSGGSGHNFLIGGAGDDVLYGGDGDVLMGGDGADTFFLDGTPAWVDGGSKINTIVFEGYSAPGPANIRHVAIYMAADGATVDLTNFHMGVSLTPYDADLTGLHLTGSAYADTLVGGVGNDTLSGYKAADVIYAGAGANVVDGGDGNDTIGFDSLGAITDTITGGAGDDLISFTNLVSVTGPIDGGPGFDTVLTDDADLTGASFANVERLVIQGSGVTILLDSQIAAFADIRSAQDAPPTADPATTPTHQVAIQLAGGGAASFDSRVGVSAPLVVYGSGLADSIVGHAGSDTLYGGDGDDTLVGDGGSDVFDGGAGVDTVVFSGARTDYLITLDPFGGYYVRDIVIGAADGVAHLSAVEYAQFTDQTVSLSLTVPGLSVSGGGGGDTLYGSAVSDTLHGNAGADVLYGGAQGGPGLGNDLLDGGLGADTLYGGLGDDTYIVDSIGDRVVEQPGEGFDTILTAMTSYSLVAAPNVEALTYTGGGAFSGAGNAQNNILTGGSGADTLSGGGGVDTLVGGAGADLYFVDDSRDVIVETPAGGVDSVKAGVSYALPDNVEKLVLTAPGLTGTGNALSNLISGTAGSDMLDGGGGVDTLQGGAGDDTYIVDDQRDVVTEAANGGSDTVLTALSSYTLPTNVETLVFTGSGSFQGVGNASANAIVGGSGDDQLSGGAGADTLSGSGGNDTLDGGAGVDLAVFAGPQAQYAVSGDGTGGYLVADLLDGWTAHLTAIETVSFSDTGPEALAPLAGAGPGSGAGSGPAGAITLTGSDGADSLYGGAGPHVIYGGGGDDYIRTLTGMGPDTIDGGAGTDLLTLERTDATVALTLDLTLGGTQALGEGSVITGIEQIRIAGGSGNDSFVGGAFDDVLKGGAGDDTLVGNGGNDVLQGGAGHDVLTGGDGGDTFRFDGPVPGSDDTVTDFATGIDHVALSKAGFGIASLADFDIVDASAGPIAARATLIVDTINHTLSWDADGVGPGASTLLAHGAFTTNASDYLVF